MNGSRPNTPIRPWRIYITYTAIAVILALFIRQLYSLQILQGESFLTQADENRFTRISIPAPRGVIYDRNRSQIVENVPSFIVTIVPAELPDSQAEIEAIFRRLSALTGVPIDLEGPVAAPCVPGRGIRQFVEEGDSFAPFESWPIACDVDETTARVLREEQIDLPGVYVEVAAIREYTQGELSAAIIGYLGPVPAEEEAFWRERGLVPDRDRIGYAGIELTYQNVLAGQNGQRLVEEDVAGQQLREVGAGNPPIPGNSLMLTIDSRLQAAAHTALQNRMEFLNRFAGDVRTTIGTVIAMNPNTGEILAMVTLPTYENNRMARFIPAYYYNQLFEDPNTPLVNHAISSTFPPGSSFKMVTAVGALNEGVITPERTLNDPGKITITNTYFPNDPGKAKDFVCWKEDGHGPIDFVHGIAQSCNVYFYKIGGGFENEILDEGLNVERLGIYARALGYGIPLGIDLPGEDGGLIPTRDWKRINLGENWSTGDTYNSVVGQGFVGSTPLQVLTSIATLANGGRVMLPHIVSQILDGEGNLVHQYEPCMLWDISDGVLFSIDQIAAGCTSLPAERLESIRDNYRQAQVNSPDIDVDPFVIARTQEGMRLVVTEGTAAEYAQLETISSAGKTGTGEFCDETAFDRGLCEPGNWPTHAWYTAYAPFENPEIVVTAFVYNGGEGAVTSGPIVRQVLEAYFELKAIDIAQAAR